jgi:predicted Zn-dependent peptidase
MAFHMCNRFSSEYYTFDVITDLLSNGRSSRFIQTLVQQKKRFASIDAYISGSLDEGLLHITGKPAPGISLEEAEQTIWEELDKLKTSPVSAEELEKVKNRYESEQIFNNINYLNVATNLAFYELIGKAEDINTEVDKYRSVTPGQIQETAKRTFVPENCNILYYKAIQ